MKKAFKIVAIVAGVVVLGVMALAIFAASRAEAKITFSDAPAPQVVASQDPAIIARGRYLVNAAAHCSQCHGDYPRDKPAQNVDGVALSGGLEFRMGPLATTWAANLTPAGIGALTDAQLARVIATGVQHDGKLSLLMRYAAAKLSRDDLIAVISYLRSLPPVARAVPRGYLKPLGKVAVSFLHVAPDLEALPSHAPEAAEPSLERGAYLAEHVARCVACHTTFDRSTFEPSGPKAGGGAAEPSHGSDTDKEFAPPNLTSSPTGRTGMLAEDAFLARMKAGRVFASSIMPWENFGRMTDADLRSIYRYLKSLPPVDHDNGPSYRDIGWKPPAESGSTR
jgi:mono/diheme cytochrome c family protein